MASLVEKAKEAVTRRSEGVVEVPDDVLKQVQRGEKAVKGQNVRWQEALAFLNNDQWVEVSAVDGTLDRLEQREGGTKPRYRSRLTRNKFTPAFVREASLLAHRRPEYEVTPPHNDPEALNQSRLSEKVLAYEDWHLALPQRGIDTILLAMATGAGFSMPFWNADVGAWVRTEEGTIRLGEVDIEILHQGEVLWEAGVSFEKSGWHCVRKAQAVSKVKQKPGYIGPSDLKADAKAGNWERPGDQFGELVFVYNYFELPCPKYPRGRWLTFCQNTLIAEPQDYPRKPGPNGEVKRCIHKLPWIPQPHRHRDLGAGEMCVDIQRTYHRTINQLITWKNYCLNPQLLAPKGSITGEVTEEPGAIIEYRPIAGMAPEWRVAPEIPQSIFETLDRCERDLDDVLGMRDLPAGVESGTGITKAVEREGSFRSIFVQNLAAFYASQGEHILEIVQARYTEPRLLLIQGRLGTETIPDFLGRQLGTVGSVRVQPSTIEPRTRAQVEARVRWLAEMQWVEPHQAMAAINGGTAEHLLDDYELDIARQHREIRDLLVLAGWEPAMREKAAARLRAVGMDINNTEADPALAEMPSLPMAEEYDNHAVHMDVLKSWMKTREFEQQPDLIKQAARFHLQQHQFLMSVEVQQQFQLMNAKAENQGQQNAAKEQGPKRLPSPQSEREQEKEVAGGGVRPAPPA